MHLRIMRSRRNLDLNADTSEFLPSFGLGNIENSDDLIHGWFRPEGPTSAVLSLGWADVEAAIAAFAKKGHPGAVILESAGKLATAIQDNRQ